MSDSAQAPTRGSSLRSVWRDLQVDVATAVKYASDFSGDHLSPLRRLSVLLTPPLLCIAIYRLSHWCYCRGLLWPARFLSWTNFIIHRADIAHSAEIGPGLYVPHTVGVVFRGRAGSFLTLYFRSAVVGSRLDSRRDPQGPDCPCLGDHVTVGIFSLVKGPVHVGDRAFLGVGSVVLADLPADVQVIGAKSAEWRPREGVVA